MSSPFKNIDLRAKLMLWAFAILFLGFVYIRNGDAITNQLSTIIDEAGDLDMYVSGPDTNNLISGDSDNDGLDNILEVALNGDRTIADTDQDGFTDYQEFLSGYPIDNPGGSELSEAELNELFALFEAQYLGPYYISTEYYNKRISGLLDQGQEAIAFSLLRHNLPNQSLIWLEDYYLSNEQYEKMFQVAFRRAELYPQEASAFFSAGYASHLQDDLENAMKYYRISESLGSDDAALYNNIGVLLVLNEQYAEAVEYYGKAIELEPNRKIYLENIISAYQDLGAPEQATQYEQQLANIIDKSTDSQ